MKIFRSTWFSSIPRPTRVFAVVGGSPLIVTILWIINGVGYEPRHGSVYWDEKTSYRIAQAVHVAFRWEAVYSNAVVIVGADDTLRPHRWAYGTALNRTNYVEVIAKCSKARTVLVDLAFLGTVTNQDSSLMEALVGRTNVFLLSPRRPMRTLGLNARDAVSEHWTGELPTPSSLIYDRRVPIMELESAPQRGESIMRLPFFTEDDRKQARFYLEQNDSRKIPRLPSLRRGWLNYKGHTKPPFARLSIQEAEAMDQIQFEHLIVVLGDVSGRGVGLEGADLHRDVFAQPIYGAEVLAWSFENIRSRRYWTSLSPFASWFAACIISIVIGIPIIKFARDTEAIRWLSLGAAASSTVMTIMVVTLVFGLVIPWIHGVTVPIFIGLVAFKPARPLIDPEDAGRPGLPVPKVFVGYSAGSGLRASHIFAKGLDEAFQKFGVDSQWSGSAMKGGINWKRAVTGYIHRRCFILIFDESVKTKLMTRSPAEGIAWEVEKAWRWRWHSGFIVLNLVPKQTWPAMVEEVGASAEWTQARIAEMRDMHVINVDLKAGMNPKMVAACLLWVLDRHRYWIPKGIGVPDEML